MNKIHYRPEIDGLRAIAVLSVVIGHFFPQILPGGFIGVDVFFVISGFLISQILFQQFNNQSFKFSQFYSRRIRRIFPALIVVLFAVWWVGKEIFFIHEFSELSKHILGATLFISNFVLLSEIGYFEEASTIKPLLHLWSLGIEEQFYIFFPYFLYLIHRKKLSLFIFIFILFLFSFSFNIFTIHEKPMNAFYLPWMRIWELLAGALLAKIINQSSASFCIEWHASFLHFLSIVGFLLLFMGFLLIHEGLSFPGFWALIPVLGTIFLILSGQKTGLNRVLLTNPFSIFLGKISYALYLWHWPIFSFLKIYYGEVPSTTILLIFLGLAFLLAILTTFLIENPIRFGSFNRLKVQILCCLMLVLASFSYVEYFFPHLFGKNLFFGVDLTCLQKAGELWRTNNLGVCFLTHRGKPLNHRVLMGIDGSCVRKGDAWWQSHRGNVCERGNRQAQKRILLFGDSHAQVLEMQLLEKLGSEYAIDFLNSPSCLAGKSRWRSGSVNGEPKSCERMREHLLNMPVPDIVITANYLSPSMDNFEWKKEQVIEAIEDKIAFFEPAPPLMIVLGDPGEVDYMCESAKRRLGKKEQKPCKKAADFAFHYDFYRWTRSHPFPDFVQFIYPFFDFCTQSGCQFLNQNGRMNYADNHHLSWDGSIPVVEKIVAMIRAHEQKSQQSFKAD